MSRSKGDTSYCNLCGRECEAGLLVPFDFRRLARTGGRPLPHRFQGMVCQDCRDRETAAERGHGTADPQGGPGAGDGAPPQAD